jgi:hypothetical protein
MSAVEDEVEFCGVDETEVSALERILSDGPILRLDLAMKEVAARLSLAGANGCSVDAMLSMVGSNPTSCVQSFDRLSIIF